MVIPFPGGGPYGGGSYRAADATEQQYMGAQEVLSNALQSFNVNQNALQSFNVNQRASKSTDEHEIEVVCDINKKTIEICQIYDNNPQMLTDDVKSSCNLIRQMAEMCKLVRAK